MNPEETAFLKDELEKLRKAREVLFYSYKICIKIGAKQDYNSEEQDRFESLTSRFARLSDIIIKQAFKAIDMLELEDAAETVRDAINRAEKKALIASAESFLAVRALRNHIAHEYASASFVSIFHDVLDKTPILFDAVDRIHRYCQKFLRESPP